LEGVFQRDFTLIQILEEHEGLSGFWHSLWRKGITEDAP
jgi:hypothetical protein